MSFKSMIKNTLHFVTGASLLEQQIHYTKMDLANFTKDTKHLHARLKIAKTPQDEWNRFVLAKNITASNLVTQYHKRRLIAYFLLVTFFYSIYFIIYDYSITPGLAGALISAIYYFRNSLRLYQIRYCQLCSVKAYLNIVKKTFKEALPLALPKEWSLLPTKTGGKRYDI